MKNNISDYLKCSACGACVNICPKDAISIIKDCTFYELTVDNNLCINCGRCKEVCPVNLPADKQNIIKAYGGYSIDHKLVKKSSSGGAFTAFSDNFLEHGFAIVSAVYNYENNIRAIQNKC